MIDREDRDARQRGWRIAAVEVALIWILFLLQAGSQVPELNEPYYLAKAKHYWNPEWCAGDFFLNTADAHTVFYWTFGWLTLLLPLHAVALIGRLLASGLLAWGWQRLSTALVPRPWWSVLSAGLFVTFLFRLHMAGEWIVGGVESKCVAYAFVFFGLANVLRNRWNRGWILLGIASAFHVLVGGWATLAAALTWWAARDDVHRPRIRSMAPALAVACAIALLGLVPVLGLARHQDPQIALQAHSIQVFDRLPHHLNPRAFLFQAAPPFLTMFGIRFLGLTAAWWVLQRACPETPAHRRLRRFVLSVLVFAVVGCLVGAIVPWAPDVAAWLLRFYWFRLSDCVVPMALALAIPAWLIAMRSVAPRWVGTWRIAAVALVALHLGAINAGRYVVGIPRADESFCKTAERAKDWRACCDFVATSTAPDAIFLTPRHSHTFKWQTNRAEVAIWKEMPQDAASVVAWWDRLDVIHRGPYGRYRTLSQRSARDLRAIGVEYGARYLVTASEPFLNLPILYRNDSYAVYQLFAEPTCATEAR